MKDSIEVLIRYNTNHIEGNPLSKEWRVLINGIEKQCNNVIINCSSKTSKNQIADVGLKWHIKCDAQKIDFISDDSHKDEIHFKEIVIS